MSNIHLVTGGTGFVGAGIILELLQQTSAEIICIIRPGMEPVNTRLHKALTKAAQLYGYDSALLATIQERCRAVPGDVTSELCGVRPHALPRVTQFWHCAASLHYEDRYKAEIFQTNVDGTRYAVELARRVGVDDTFNYISTAYVAGTRTGAIYETLEETPSTNNHYETSKIQAEQVVTAVTDFRTRLFRPSIVVGHSATYAVASGFSGPYLFLKKFLQFKEAMSRVREGLLAEHTVRLRVDSDGLLNCVPIDAVARQAVGVSISSSPENIFHLTNTTPPTVSELFYWMFHKIGLKPPSFTATRDEFNWIDRKFDQVLTFYQSYLVGIKLFDRSHTDAALGNPNAGAHRADPEKLCALYQWYIDFLGADRHQLPAIQ